MPIRPPKGKIIVTPIFDPDMIGLLYVPDQAKQRCDHGVVKYIGADDPVRDVYPSDSRVGDVVLFSGYTGTLILIEKELVMAIPYEFVSATIMPDSIPISGLYHRGKDKKYFEATYESVIEQLAMSLQRSEWNERLKVKVPRPNKEEVTWK